MFSSPTDTAELDHLQSRVQNQLQGRMRDLRLERRGSGIVLTGHARSYYAKQLAQHAVMQASDCPILANEIEVATGFSVAF